MFRVQWYTTPFFAPMFTKSPLDLFAKTALTALELRGEFRLGRQATCSHRRSNIKFAPRPQGVCSSVHTRQTQLLRDARVSFLSPLCCLLLTVSQERRAIRQNPAVIPKLGAFFVHDDRSGGSGGKTGAGKQGGRGEGGDGPPEEEEEGEEEATLGRWRADALTTTKKKTGGEQW